jgi:FkbM family methyltransferase
MTGAHRATAMAGTLFLTLAGFGCQQTVPARPAPLEVPVAEAAPLKAKYGPKRYSQHYEEWVLRDYFGDRRNGTFVDVGANDPQLFSNTYYLENTLGWSGIAVDPVASFAPAYEAKRPRTRFFPFFVSDVTDARVKLFIPGESTIAVSSSREFAERFKKSIREWEAPTIRLTDLLDRVGLKRMDLLSIDVELAEGKVLAGFDIDRFRPTLVCIEAHPEVRQVILDYFAGHRYVLVGRYLRADGENLYFEPLTR